MPTQHSWRQGTAYSVPGTSHIQSPAQREGPSAPFIAPTPLRLDMGQGETRRLKTVPSSVSEANSVESSISSSLEIQSSGAPPDPSAQCYIRARYEMYACV